MKLMLKFIKEDMNLPLVYSSVSPSGIFSDPISLSPLNLTSLLQDWALHPRASLGLSMESNGQMTSYWNPFISMNSVHFLQIFSPHIHKWILVVQIFLLAMFLFIYHWHKVASPFFSSLSVHVLSSPSFQILLLSSFPSIFVALFSVFRLRFDNWVSSMEFHFGVIGFRCVLTWIWTHVNLSAHS